MTTTPDHWPRALPVETPEQRRNIEANHEARRRRDEMRRSVITGGGQSAGQRRPRLRVIYGDRARRREVGA